MPMRPKTKRKSILLFNGKDLEGWTPVLADKRAKPNEVWEVRDGGVFGAEGKPKGYLRT